MKTLTLAATALAGWSASASGASIGLYADSAGATCAATLRAGDRTIVQVWAETDRAIDSGEFRIAGLPSGWTARAFLLDESASISMSGNPTSEGVTFWIGGGHGGRIALFGLWVEATSDERNVVLEVTRHSNPSPPPGTPSTCAWVHEGPGAPADAPGVCVQGGRFTINGTGDCFVLVRDWTWTAVRQLYR